MKRSSGIKLFLGKDTENECKITLICVCLGVPQNWIHLILYEQKIPSAVRPRLSGPLLSGSRAIRKKIVGYRFTAYAMHTL